MEATFEGCPSIRRAFSLARANGMCKAVVVEKIGAEGLLKEDNENLG